MFTALERQCPSVRPLTPLTIIYAVADVLSSSLCSLNIPNLCDNFVKKVVPEVRKCRQRQRDESL